MALLATWAITTLASSPAQSPLERSGWSSRTKVSETQNSSMKPMANLTGFKARKNRFLYVSR